MSTGRHCARGHGAGSLRRRRHRAGVLFIIAACQLGISPGVVANWRARCSDFERNRLFEASDDRFMAGCSGDQPAAWRASGRTLLAFNITTARDMDPFRNRPGVGMCVFRSCWHYGPLVSVAFTRGESQKRLPALLASINLSMHEADGVLFLAAGVVRQQTGCRRLRCCAGNLNEGASLLTATRQSGSPTSSNAYRAQGLPGVPAFTRRIVASRRRPGCSPLLQALHALQQAAGRMCASSAGRRVRCALAMSAPSAR